MSQKARLLALILLCTTGVLCRMHSVYAQSGGPSQPETAQFEPVDVTDLVNLATGDFTYSLPLMAVPGPSGDYPINLSYHAGIGTNQEATWVGLGWTLNPGAVNRTVSGYPDDYRGDYVQTHFEAAPQGGYGIGAGVGYGPFGMNVTYDSHTGMAGVNFYGTLGYSLGDYGRLGLTVGIGTSGYSAQASAGYAGFSASVGISVSAEGAAGLSAGLAAPGNTSVGYSLSTSGSGANVSVAGVGFSSSAVASEGELESFAYAVSIPIYDVWVSLSYSEWQWTLNETYQEKSYGFIHQSPYLSDAAGTEEKKYERYKQGRYLYPSHDLYQVNAQGLAGLFRPVAKKPFELIDWSSNRHKAVLNDPGAPWRNTAQDVVFRFLDDPGANFVTAGGSYLNLFSDRYGSKRIQPSFSPDGKIMGFDITNADGTLYRFTYPAKNYLQYTWTEDKAHNTASYTLMGTPYVANWLLTEIQGPDYVDRDEYEGCSGGDWGYCVNFQYDKAQVPHLWRSPYAGMGPASLSEDVETASFGARDMVFLRQIETPSHVALFRTSERKDGGAAPIWSSDSLLLHWSGDQIQPRYDPWEYELELEFLGNWKALIDRSAGANVDLIEVREVVSVSEPALDGSRTLHHVEKRTLVLKQTDLLQCISRGDKTAFRFRIRRPGSFGDGYNPGSTFSTSVEDATFYIKNLQSSPYTVATKLDRIDLYPKSASGVSRNSLGQWSASDEAVPISSVVLEYNYSLSPGTPNSQATAADGTVGGKLTLKAVEFLGRGGEVGIPPYQFVYANGDPPGTGLNPAYYQHGWDKWGSYRYPIVYVDGLEIYTPLGSQYEHDTPQEKRWADFAAAWSLTQIVTPTGGTIDIEYERDDYYHINDFVDLGKLGDFVDQPPNLPQPMTLFANGPVVPGPGGNTLRIPVQHIPSDPPLKEGTFLTILEVYNAPSRIYRNEVDVTVRRVEQIAISPQFVTVTFSGNPISFSSSSLFSYYVKPFPARVYGGDIRVKSLALSDAGTTYKTIYSYQDEEGYSTGVTPTLPAPYGALDIEETETHREGDWYWVTYNDWEDYRALYLDHEENYGRPAPGVIYSRVEVMNVDEKGAPVSGKTAYQFYTAADYPYGPQDNRPSGPFSILDQSGIYGKLRRVTYYEQTGPSTFRPVKEDQVTYAFSTRLHNSSKIFDDTDREVAHAASKPLGLTQERYWFTECKDSDRAPNCVRRAVERSYENVYVIGEHAFDRFYSPAPTTAVPPTSTRFVRNFIWDARTGQSIASVTQTSDERALVQKTVPAYWKYAAMDAKNMLTQTAEAMSYLGDFDAFGERDVLAYDFAPDDIVAGTVTTWRDWGDGLWRKNDTYVYNKAIDRASGSAYNPFTDWAYTSSSYPEVSAGNPWRMTSNITAYDAYSHPIEESHRDGTYTSTRYGYGGAMPIAVTANAPLSQMAYFNFETQEGLRTLGTPSAYFTGDGYGRADQKAFKAYTGSGGAWYEISGLQRFEEYRVSFWAKKGTADISQSLRFYFHGPGLAGSGIPVDRNLQTEDQWEYFEMILIPLASDVIQMFIGLENVSGAGGLFHYVDDVRIHPIDASMSTFTYDPLTLQLTSFTDENNVTVYYEYDALGRLTHVRDQDRHLVTKHTYNYARSQP